MKSTTTLIGMLLILFGVFALAYQGYTYTKHENVAQIGDLHVTADTQKTVYFSPVWGGLSLVAGVAFVVVGRRRKS